MSALKVLYVAHRHDPVNPDLSSGADYQFFRSLCDQGAQVTILGPFYNAPYLLERVFRRFYRVVTKKKYAKFPISIAWFVSQQLNQAVRDLQPDIIFTIFPPALTFYTGNIPCIYRQDTSFWGWQAQYPEFGRLGYKISIWSEKKAFSHCSRIITHSEWNKNILIEQYGLKAENLFVTPNPAALPFSVIPEQLGLLREKKISSPLRLLFVGRDPVRKGEDIAVKVVRLLNAKGVPAQLTICGMLGKEQESFIHYVGTYKKSIPEELNLYIKLFQQSHLLLHPARFDPSPIVTAEAAAFGTPTITNDVGGVATSVINNVSGIVLPKHSPAELYAQKIMELMKVPEIYYQLCRSARERYERELNWDVAGRRLIEIIKKTISEHKASK